MFEPDSLEAALDALGAILADRGLAHELVAIGGGSLLLLRLIERPTKDLDLVAVVVDGAYVSADPLPSSLIEAAQDVAQLFGLPADWLNGGPTAQLKAGLPPRVRATRPHPSTRWNRPSPRIADRSGVSQAVRRRG